MAFDTVQNLLVTWRWLQTFATIDNLRINDHRVYGLKPVMVSESMVFDRWWSANRWTSVIWNFNNYTRRIFKQPSFATYQPVLMKLHWQLQRRTFLSLDVVVAVCSADVCEESVHATGLRTEEVYLLRLVNATCLRTEPGLLWLVNATGLRTEPGLLWLVNACIAIGCHNRYRLLRREATHMRQSKRLCSYIGSLQDFKSGLFRNPWFTPVSARRSLPSDADRFLYARFLYIGLHD